MTEGPSPNGEGLRREDAAPGDHVWVTQDLDVAAFILSQAPIDAPTAGIRMTSLRRLGRGREFSFVFLDPHGKIEELAVAYLNSPAHRFAAAVRTIKKLINAQGPNGGNGLRNGHGAG